MIRGCLDRMMRPRDLVVTYHRVHDPDAPGPLRGVTGVFTTEHALRRGDHEILRQIDVSNLADGQVVKIKR